MLFGHEIPATKALILLCLLAVLPLTTTALFTDGFQAFLAKEFGTAIKDQLTRADIGVNGSFGGNNINSQIKIFRDPLILVHGLNANASSLIPARDFFNKLNYGIGEVYATSYGPSAKSFDGSSSLECSYIKQIRQLIVAVTAYTKGKRVSVIGYSTGAPIARKAILGGNCVDTNEVLGTPLTSQINTFISVAGANLGSVECANSPSAKLCGNTNGIKTGSSFLKDINSKSAYEGSARYSIASKSDQVIGFDNSGYSGSQINVTLYNFGHSDTLYNTLNIQSSFITKGFVEQQKVDKDAFAETKIAGKSAVGAVSRQDAFLVGPHVSQQALRGGGGSTDFTGEYVRQSNSFKFLNGIVYKKHEDPVKGKSFAT